MELSELIISMAGLMSVSGYESRSFEDLKALCGDAFDECHTDCVGNIVFVKKCGRDEAPAILIDTHFDEIGMFVTDILDGGFLSVTNIGGLDTRILQASDVLVYGNNGEKIFGVVASTPPHLRRPDDNGKLKSVDKLIIDTGYSKEELQKILRVGSPVGFVTKYTELQNGRLAGKGFDNKACGACAVYALSNIPKEKLAGDVYLMFSCHEETDRNGGAAVGTFNIKPNYAMVVDVNLGRTPDVEKFDTVVMDMGASITFSSSVNRTLTKMTEKAAKDVGIACQRSVCPSSTGTNATTVNLTGKGVPTVDVGLPLYSMHTYNEVLSLFDANELARLIEVFVCDTEIAEVFAE